MSKKLLISILILIIALGGVYFIVGGKSIEKFFNDAYNKLVNSGSLLERPNADKFKEYFTETSLAKLPAGEKIVPDKMVKTEVFTSADQFCSSMSTIKLIPEGKLATAIYNVGAKKYAQEKSVFPVELNQGTVIGCENLTYPVGEYEFKIYVDDILASVLPFKIE